MVYSATGRPATSYLVLVGWSERLPLTYRFGSASGPERSGGEDGGTRRAACQRPMVDGVRAHGARPTPWRPPLGRAHGPARAAGRARRGLRARGAAGEPAPGRAGGRATRGPR